MVWNRACKMFGLHQYEAETTVRGKHRNDTVIHVLPLPSSPYPPPHRRHRSTSPPAGTWPVCCLPPLPSQTASGHPHSCHGDNGIAQGKTVHLKLLVCKTVYTCMLRCFLYKHSLVLPTPAFILQLWSEIKNWGGKDWEY